MYIHTLTNPTNSASRETTCVTVEASGCIFKQLASLPSIYKYFIDQRYYFLFSYSEFSFAILFCCDLSFLGCPVSPGSILLFGLCLSFSLSYWAAGVTHTHEDLQTRWEQERIERFDATAGQIWGISRFARAKTAGECHFRGWMRNLKECSWNAIIENCPHFEDLSNDCSLSLTQILKVLEDPERLRQLSNITLMLASWFISGARQLAEAVARSSVPQVARSWFGKEAKEGCLRFQQGIPSHNEFFTW